MLLMFLFLLLLLLLLLLLANQYKRIKRALLIDLLNSSLLRVLLINVLNLYEQRPRMRM